MEFFEVTSHLAVYIPTSQNYEAIQSPAGRLFRISGLMNRVISLEVPELLGHEHLLVGNHAQRADRSVWCGQNQVGGGLLPESHEPSQRSQRFRNPSHHFRRR